tara:strand:- start:318 stop:923 length:606 start_codon:yes stop_codon:yes gene_type:complete
MEKTKNIILREGFRSVLRTGIKSFTVENLASSLTMSKKTIYQYFPKKEILLKKIIDFRMNKLTNEFKEIIKDQDDAVIQFVNIRNHHIEFSNRFNLKKLTHLKARHPEIWEIIEKHRIDRKTIYKDIFKLAKLQSYLREDLDPDVCSSLYMNITNSTFQPEFLNENCLEIGEAVNHLRVILSNGFFNNKGIKIMNKYSDLL